MKEFLHSAKFLALDLASTLIFVAVFALTKNLYISAGLGIAMGVGQVIWTYAKGKKPDAMQWMMLTNISSLPGSPFTFSAPATNSSAYFRVRWIPN